ncbi:MAG TPA: nucleoside triphosphate pyrophosphohydrolase [Bacteroidota bacterium]|nr:nucleoside triphosphate pyrophosphohydrolase [Bacteroidota bacterium]
MKKKRTPFEEYVAIVRRLRKECPWDRVQTHQSIRHALIEEAYEVVDAVESRDMDALRDELGDLLLHVALHGIMAEEKDSFTIDEVLEASRQKLIRRHPHVFGSGKARTAGEVAARWEILKKREGRASVLDGVPKHMPALLQARRLQERAAKVGFDWSRAEDVLGKIREELLELRSASRKRNRRNVEEEIGDLLFSVVNYARFTGTNPELALRRSAAKFKRRFHFIEKQLDRKGSRPERESMKQLDRLWEMSKKKDGE